MFWWPLSKYHLSVHKTAQKIAQLYKDARHDEARKLFSEFQGITGKLFELLDQLESEVEETEPVAAR